MVALHPGVEWLPLGENRGFPAAVNAGIAASTAPLIALLEHRRVWPSRAGAEALVGALGDDPTISLGASRMLFPDGTVNAAGDAFDVRGRGGYNRGIREPDGPRFDEPRIVFGACAGAALYRRALFHDIGLFDEQLFLLVGGRRPRSARRARGTSLPVRPRRGGAARSGSSSDASRLGARAPQQGLACMRGLPGPLLLPFLALPAAAARGLRGARRARGRPRLAATAGAVRAGGAPRARWRRTVSRRVPVRTLLPLLLSDSQPYVGCGRRARDRTEERLGELRDGSRAAWRTTT